jgi:hypothetical protein
MVLQIKESEQELDEELKETRFRFFLIWFEHPCKTKFTGAPLWILYLAGQHRCKERFFRTS